ncbi:GDP-mannose 4,6-dehydratase [Aquipuribacter hungaricus]|uniref:GDP-mannose 4,6-dehydratase n=1 Tax=Aquipuribacter hungaricus TaxID=545624 RepID=A0ABV7WKI4_9MICO
MPEGRRALVTGVTGQDGGYLAEQLLGEGWQVTGLVRDADEVVTAGVDVEVGDLSDPDLFPALLGRARPDVVFHLAGLSSVARSWDEPALAADVTGAAVARLLGAVAAQETPPRVVVASSAEVFGGGDVSPQDEATPVRPGSPYGAAKAYAWHLARVYRATGLFVSVALLYNHESPRRPDAFVTRKITRGAVDVARGAQQELRLGNLDAVRDWGWAPDYVRALRLMAQADAPDDFVVATGQGRTVRELVATAFAAAGVPAWEDHVVVDPRFYRPVDSVALVGDASHARRVLGWEPSVTFEEIVGEMVEADRAAAAVTGTS